MQLKNDEFCTADGSSAHFDMIKICQAKNIVIIRQPRTAEAIRETTLIVFGKFDDETENVASTADEDADVDVVVSFEIKSELVVEVLYSAKVIEV